MKKFKILHIGTTNDLYINDDKIETYFISTDYFSEDSLSAIQMITNRVEAFDFIFLQTKETEIVKFITDNYIEPYNTYVDYRYWDALIYNDQLITRYKIRPIEYNNAHHLKEIISTIAFSGQYGDKVIPTECIVNKNFNGTYYYHGHHSLVLEGDFGTDFTSLVSWKKNLFYEGGKATEVFPGFSVEGDIKIEYIFRIYNTSNPNQIIETIRKQDTELMQPMILPLGHEDRNISISLRAKGNGKLTIGAIHRRWSRLEFGELLLGGSKFVDDVRDEFIYYFSPGDMKPPLNVYFSGYRPAEGFEGFFMMKKLKAPFLLIGDPRIEGGAFYLGTESYEKGIVQTIESCLKELNFTNKELILSGLSMGSFGALYYGALLTPAAIIVGKPLINLGNIADNMRLVRPNDFGTSLDVLISEVQATNEKAIQKLNNKFWNVFKRNDLSDVIFALAYMYHDDYDVDAYDRLLEVLSPQNAQVMSRGVPGRHNDDTSTIANWFINFYNIIMEKKFGRYANEKKR